MKKHIQTELKVFLRWFEEMKCQITLTERKELIKEIKKGLK